MTHFVVIGLGSIGRRHAANLAALRPDARMTFVRRRGQRDPFTDQLGARVVTDVRALLDEAVTLAVVATPSASHVEVLPQLIDRAWPLLVEKPIVASRRDCDLIEAALDHAEPAVRIAGFNLRHLPSLQLMKQLTDEDATGGVVRASFVAGQWLPDWRPGTDYRSSYSADSELGGGVELDLSHEFDVARWCFGELEVDFARSGVLSSLGVRSSDTATAVLSPAGGDAPLITVTLDYVSRRAVRRYEIVGERGTIEWSMEGTLKLIRASGETVQPLGPDAYDVSATYRTMMHDVLAAISTGSTGHLQTMRDGLRSTRLALRVRDEGRRR